MIGNIEPADDKNQMAVTTIVTAPPKEKGPQLSTKDLNRIKEIIEKFPSLEESLAKIAK